MKLTKSLLFASVVLMIGTEAVSIASAERQPATELLPEKTVAFIRIEDVPELIERFRDTAMGRITSDQQVKPLVSQLYQSAIDAFERAEEVIGVPLDELLRLPQGEVCAAIIAPDEGLPQVVMMIELGNRVTAMEALLQRFDELLVSRGASRTVEEIDRTQIDVYQLPGERQRRITVGIKDKTLLLASDVDAAREIIGAWKGGSEDRRLSDNRKFVAIMNRCNGTEDERPQVTFYIDPFELAKKVTQDNFGARAALATAAGLGVDGIKAVGGSMIMATEEFDSIMHAHVLLETPRDGIVEMLALESGETGPEPFVPRDVASYMTLHWDVNTTISELNRLFDTFRGEGAWQQEVVDRLSDQLDVDFEEEFIDQVAGRLSMFTWMERPARLNSQTSMFAVKLNDADAFARTIDKVSAKFQERLSKESYGGITYYKVAGGRRGRQQPENPLARIPEPCFAVVGDYLLATDSTKFMKHVIVTKNDSSSSLARELDFKLIASKIQRQLGDSKAGMISFNRPEEGLRSLYELATSADVRSRLSTGAENSGFFRALNDALEKNPLPPFSVVAQYLAPGGAMVTNDETGFHYTAFGLRRD